MYCDFYSSTELDLRRQYVDALIREYALRRNELPEGEPVRTIYLGGGTPSMLEPADVARLLHALPTEQAEEVTLEANPSDITPLLLDTWRSAGVNRLSIGIQSFHNETLRMLGRRHNAETAISAVQTAQEHGFDNISIDLIYAAPEQSLDAWQHDIDEALALNVQHISTYCLTYEEHTPLYAFLKEGLVQEADDQLANDMYATVCRRLKQAGFRHYEVSNFALPGYESRHNSSYWNNTPYLGLGAGAHSYNGRVRQENLPNIYAYLKGMQNDIVPHDIESLTDTDFYNERIMLGLRTADGIEATPEALQKAQTYIRRGLLRHEDNRLIATQDGINILNRIIEDLMI
ncbi:MAG: radical SAM family heme chaperone HemW [Paludibacteraceae bacterium]|nr:radical SAM family heme chaperone HemW [Paludibacteraceae bacterium]MBR1481144.1 radical SAM family heme chaperone HemW [Paludibacteraceae bacterium]